MNKIVIAGAAVGFASVAFGGDVIVGGSANTDIMLTAKDLSPDVFGGNLPPNFANDVLAFIHSDVNADGINTDGVITILSAHTTHGLGLFVLVDKEYASQTQANLDSSISFTATGNLTNNQWVNDNSSDLTAFNNGALITGDFIWSSGSNSFDQRGDAFAWSTLAAGDEGTFTFYTDPGNGYDSSSLAQGSDAIQFVTYNENSGMWEIAGYNDLQTGGQATGMDWAVVIPLPAPAAMAMAGIAGLGVIRRRKI